MTRNGSLAAPKRASTPSPPEAHHLDAGSDEHESVCRVEKRSFLFQSIEFREPSICLFDRKACVLDHELMDEAGQTKHVGVGIVVQGDKRYRFAADQFETGPT